MAKLSKNTKTVIIAAAVLLVLGAVLLVLVMTKPAEDASDVSGGSETGTAETSSDSSSDEDSEKAVITDKQQENVLTLSVSNESGSYSFERSSREVSSTDDDGNVSTSTEYYWSSPELKGITANETTIGAFVRSMAGLSAASEVEAGASDLEKYGLAQPSATVKVTFDDGTSKELCFGIRNPAASNYVYLCEKGSSDVLQASYYSTGSAFYSITDFVSLVLTESYNAENPQELDYLIIERKDLDEPVEIAYMYDVVEESSKEDSVITTFNSHRINSPIVAELDTTSGQTVCYGLYGLNAASCLYIDPTEEQISEMGLDDPFCKVSFRYGGKDRVLLFGNQILTTENDLTSVAGYYMMFEGDRLVYSITTSKAPWYTLQVQDIMSRRPISPYIYTVDTLTVTTPDGEYVFKVTGDADEHSFTCGDTEVDDYGFRQFYQHLITSVGEELFYSDAEYEPYIKLQFKYRPEYETVYGTGEDIIEYFKSDDRKSIVSVNGSVLFKVRQVYTDRLLSNLDALLNGGEIELNW